MRNSTFYRNSLEHLLDELRIINILLARRFSELQKNESDNLFHGLAISDDRIIKLLKKLNKTSHDDKSKLDYAQDEIKIVTQEIHQKKLASLNNKIPLSLCTIKDRFSLTQFEEKILLACLASEIDSSYETIYAYLQDNISKKKPSINFILDLFCDSNEEKMFNRRYLSNQGKLRRYGIIKTIDTDPNSSANESLTLDPRILNFLLECDAVDPLMKDYSKFILPDKRPIISDSHNSILQKITSLILPIHNNEHDSNHWFCFSGPSDVGKKELVQAISYDLKKSLLCLDIASIFNHHNVLDNFASAILREVNLNESIVYIKNFDSVLEDDAKKYKLSSFLSSLETDVKLLFFGTQLNIIPDILRRKSVSTVYLPLPSHIERKLIWQSYLQDKIPKEKIIELANQFNLTAPQIESAYFMAQNMASLSKQYDDELFSAHLHAACRQQYHGKLSNLSYKIASNHSWDDLVLPSSKKVLIEEIIQYVRNKNKVFSEWGFEKKLITNKGVNILFYGQSGTGKTMAAGILAKELGFDLYKINLPNILSKYVGETEKNLDRIFAEAKSSNSILFFDEADALFGKRTELKDSHDRYANIEVSYLLQKLEEHDEIVILATNLAKNMDDAFLRRMQFLIEFPFPNKTQRLMIWKNSFPQSCPLNITENEFNFLANNFDLSGGNIKNIVISAAFLASEDSAPIDMKHVILSIKKEYEKIGKSYNRSEFGEYFTLVQNFLM